MAFASTQNAEQYLSGLGLRPNAGETFDAYRTRAQAGGFAMPGAADDYYSAMRAVGIVTPDDANNYPDQAPVAGTWTPNQTDYKSGVIPTEDLARGASYVDVPQEQKPTPGSKKNPKPDPTPASGKMSADTQDATAQPIDYTLRPGESIQQYNQRIAQARGEQPIPGVSDGTQQTGAQSQANIDYTLHPGETIAQYNARIATARGEIPGSVGTGGTNSYTDSGFADSQSGKGLTSGGQGQEPSTFVGIYKDIIKSLGLTDIKSEFKKTVEAQAKLQNELNDKISEINDNPWLSEGVRVKEIEKMKEKYDTKLEILTNKQQIYDSLYKEGVQQAQYLATGEYNAQADAAALAEKRAEAQAKLLEVDPSNFKEVQGGLYDIKEQKWLVQPKAESSTGGGASPTSYKEWELAGGLSGTGKTYAQFIENVKPATVAQQTVATYAARIEQAIPGIDSLTKYISNLNPITFEYYKKVPSYLQSEEYRQFDQAARNFINATLRRESGAVISPSEFDNAYKQYLPRSGDDAKTLEQKRINREIVYKSLVQGAGQAYQSVNDLLGTSSKDPLGLGI